MSSQNNEPKPNKRRDYVVQSDGPVNVRGALNRSGDTVSLTETEAKSYGALVKRAPKEKQPPAKPAAKLTAKSDKPKV